MPQHRGQCGHLFASWDNHKLCASCRTCSEDNVCNICQHWNGDLWKRHNNRRIYKTKRNKSLSKTLLASQSPYDWTANKPFAKFPSNTQCGMIPQAGEVMNFPISYSNTNSHPAEPMNAINMPRSHIMPSLKLLETSFDPNKQANSSFMSPVWVKQEHCEETTKLPETLTPNPYTADDHSIAEAPLTACLAASTVSTNQIPSPSSTGLTTNQYSSMYSGCELSQKDFPSHSTNLSCLGSGGNNIKIQNNYSVPLDLQPTMVEDDRYVRISQKCLKTLMSLVSCPMCQAPVNHQETIQGFKAGTLFCLNLFCYNGHNIQPRW